MEREGVMGVALERTLRGGEGFRTMKRALNVLGVFDPPKARRDMVVRKLRFRKE